MTRNYWTDLAPSLLVGVGIVVATLVAVLAAGSGWLVMAGPLLLALAMVSADALGSRLRGVSSRPSLAALILAAAFLLAGLIVTLRDPGRVKALIPAMGVIGWATLLLRPRDWRKSGGGI